MWVRKELKAKGKAAFKANYWRCVLVALILTAIVAGGAGVSGANGVNNAIDQNNPGQAVESAVGIESEELASQLSDLQAEAEDAGISGIVVAVVAGVLGLALIVGLLIDFLLLNPLSAGCHYFFARNSHEKAGLGHIAAGFESGYGRVVKIMLLTDVFLILWYCLFIIPGIIKTYSYRMVPYIVADQPELEGREAINRSREMMNGNKWRAFVLDLSFILWGLLSLITLGIVGVFYVNPYYQATNAELYHALKAENPAPTF
ncbi:MAG: DUF975 family protein [Firmicutes bacterium]|nr:DUF975 family protein [Bacillota bacterium]